MKNLYENWRYGFYYDELERKLEGKTRDAFCSFGLLSTSHYYISIPDLRQSSLSMVRTRQTLPL